MSHSIQVALADELAESFITPKQPINNQVSAGQEGMIKKKKQGYHPPHLFRYVTTNVLSVIRMSVWPMILYCKAKVT